MPNCKTAIPFAGTKEQESQLHAAIEANRNRPGRVMPILQAAQGIYGYLPEEVLIIIAQELDIPLSELYGIATFYSQFTLNPKGEYRISVCMGTACYVKGAGDVLKAIEDKLGIKAGGITPDGKFSIDACRCVGACGLAPVMMINDDVYGKLTKKQVGDIINKYK